MTSPIDIDAASEPYGITAEDIDRQPDATRLDVRRGAVFSEATALVPGAHWRDPADVLAWQPALPRDRPVVVYCVHGHAVSRGVVLQLRAAGIEAWFLRGGIEGWQAAGRPIQSKGAAS
jgi:Fe-Mn family superoxide dismutase